MKICLNCGCSMVRDEEENCPVCGRAVKKEQVVNTPFGEKHGEDSNTPATH